ncbi:MAG: ABC transporter permease, partial [Gammaproteobacteria bacterium]|nr:ABC transporter permease [Gammaproteobacteria bacterium]
LRQLDRMLARYGGVRAYARKDQLSNWFLMNEIEQLRAISTLLPTIFLAVAVFLTNTLLSRIIDTERGEIGLMKAFGYSNAEVGWQYAKLVIVMTSIGIVLGFFLGAYMGWINAEIYSDFYHFPFLYFRLEPQVFIIAALITLAAALLGSLRSVLRAARLPPAEAMQPPTPPSFRRDFLTETGPGRWLDQPTRIILRQLSRWPARAALTCVGIGMAIGILVMANQWMDSIDEMVGAYFYRAQRQNVTVALVEARSTAALYEFQRLPGVLAVEPARIVSADFAFGTRTHRGSIEGIAQGGRLQRIYDAGSGVVPVPPEGLVLATMLAAKLGVTVGDTVWVDIQDGRQPRAAVPVVALFETHIGMPAYMHIRALDRLLTEPPSIEYAHLLVDPAEQPALLAALKDYPQVTAVTQRQAAIENFNDTLAETLLIYVSFYSLFAAVLGFGVLYNSARIALSERGHELGTLRVLGFSRAEVSYILLGEVAVLVVLALPLGCLVGWALAVFMSSAFETELYRVPPVIEHSTYGIAIVVLLIATGLAAALVRRRLDRLNMVAVLKARE